MNAKTLEAVKRHGESLLLAFPNCTEKDPVALCKKLRRIETSVAPIILRNCNEGVPEDELDAATDKAKERAEKLMGEPLLWWSDCPVEIFFINRDPRGYALKVDDAWTRQYNTQRGANGGRIYTDWGGYGILAPDLTEQ